MTTYFITIFGEAHATEEEMAFFKIVRRTTIVKIGFKPIQFINGTIFKPDEPLDIILYAKYNSNKIVNVRVSVFDSEAKRELGFYDGYLQAGYNLEEYLKVRLRAPREEGIWKLLLIASCEGITFPDWRWNLIYFVKQEVKTETITTTTRDVSNIIFTTITTISTSSSETRSTISESIRPPISSSPLEIPALIAAIIAAGVGGYLIGRRRGALTKRGPPTT
ncbi:MAG: hypothetical protein QXQ76_04730 [Candidatus Bathyarchaeia archaeon]